VGRETEEAEGNLRLAIFQVEDVSLEVKSTNVRGIREFWGSLSVQFRHKESRRVPVVAPWTSSRRFKVFLFLVTERFTDFV